MGRNRLTTEEFIEKAKSVHGDRYTYDKVSYTDARTRITTTCKEHGDWVCQPYVHLLGKGCPTCGSKHWTVSTESFIADCNIIHKQRYDYSKTTYIASSQKVTVTCKTHGEFLITPNDHRKVRGCNSCSKTGYREDLSGTLYVLLSNELLKIGITNRSVEQRVRQINKDSGKSFKTVKTFSFTDGSIPKKLEKILILELRAIYKQPLELFDGYTECFIRDSTDNMLNKIEKVVNDNLH